MFGLRKNKKQMIEYNPATQKAVLRCSICTGEQVAGFRDRETGKFTEVTLIRGDSDLDAFMKQYHLETIVKEY